MTHGSIPIEERKTLGIAEDLIRLSVGVEEFEEYLQHDVKQALRWMQVLSNGSSGPRATFVAIAIRSFR